MEMDDNNEIRYTKGSNKAKVLLVEEPQVYKQRWYILILFSLYSATNAFQWIQYSIISNIIVKFYDVSTSAADWLSMIFMLAYIPLIFPVTWMLDRYGLRMIAVLGSSLNAIGAIMKVFSCKPDLFVATMTGQTIASIGQVFILGMPSKVAATWFGREQVSTACSFAVFGNQLGIALGFLLPPIIVPDSDDKKEVEHNLRTLFIITASVTSLLAVLVILTFKKQPKSPPSHAQANYLTASNSPQSYGDSLKKLIFDKPSVLLILSYGINTGSFYGISTLLNDEILSYYPDNLKDAGQVGLTIVLTGIVGSILCGVILDKTRAYRKTTVVVYISTLASYILYTATLDSGNLWLVYVTGSALGFTMTGYLPVGFEFAAEITYPISEGTSSGLLNASAQAFGIVLTIVMRQLMTKVSVLAANIATCVLLAVGTLLTIMVKEDLKRQRANELQRDPPTPDDESNVSS